MKGILLAAIASGAISIGLPAQTPGPGDPQPIYRVTVVSRNLEAVNYGHRDGPTPIDFQGTVLLPRAKGTAIVESHRGRVEIDVKLEHLEAPTRFGREYLTYVLWAISPEGRPRNLGEVLVDSSNKAHLKVTTDLQAFGLILTAEPYYSVSIPSDVVVAENLVRPDTNGAREAVTAKYELMPRGHYTMNLQAAQLRSAEGYGGKVSYDRYEAVLELYQAENAVQIARSLGADEYAPESMSKATALLSQARDMNARKMDSHAIVSAAREAAQMAEDARTISVKRRDDERHAQEAQRSTEQTELRIQAQQQAETDAAQARADESAERERAEAAEAQARAAQQAALAPPPPPRRDSVVVRTPSPDAAQRQLRSQLLSRLNGALIARDTPLGLVVTVTDSMFEAGRGLLPDASRRLATVAAILASYPGLAAHVEGYADSQALSGDRARDVQEAIIAQGARPEAVTAVGYGESRKVASNATAAGREQNRRVEIVIAGDPIGNRALWDRSYRLQSQR
jgi:flagellar motor protein MotB